MAMNRQRARTEREKGTYFEELICVYLCNDATYRDLYDQMFRENVNVGAGK